MIVTRQAMMRPISPLDSTNARGQESRPNRITSFQDEVVLVVDLGNCSIVIQFEARNLLTDHSKHGYKHITCLLLSQQ